MRTAGLVSEYYGSPSSFTKEELLVLLDDLQTYMHDKADSEDEGGMNKEGNLMTRITDAIEFVESLKA